MPKYRNTTSADRDFNGFRLTPGVDKPLIGQFVNDGTDVIRVAEAPAWNPVVYSGVLSEDAVIAIPEKMNAAGQSESIVQDFMVSLRGDIGAINLANYANVFFNSEDVGVVDETCTAALSGAHDISYSPVKAQIATVKLYDAGPTLVDTLVYVSGTSTETLDGPSTDATATLKLNTGTLNITAGTSGAVTAKISYAYFCETTTPSLKVYNEDHIKFTCSSPVVLRELKIKVEGTFKLKVDISLASV
jgi:hypothetical protein